MPRPAGYAQHTERLDVSLSPELRDKVAAYAAEERLSLSAAARRLIEVGLDTLRVDDLS